ncbi:MAG: CHAT domain-containing protein, partial [Verrucomicrobiota bacterium]
LLTWVVKPDGKLSFHSTPLAGPISTLVERARAQITAPDDDKPEGEPLRDLAKLLIDPIRQSLPKEENALVTFIPQGELFLVPFAALPDKKGETLIDHYIIGMSPSIELLNLAAIQKQAVAKAGNQEILIVGNPKMPGYKSRPDREAHELSPLPGAEREAKFLANALSVEPLIGEAATEVAIVARMGSARFLHFATHGLLEAGNAYNQPFLSALVFAAGQGEDGFLTVKETSRMKLHAELAVLSACDTGVGRISGDGVIGLTRGYVTAGVPSVVVSLWPVNDQATAVLMANYYKFMMADNLPKAAALRQAILQVKNQFPDPKLWAPVVLYGLAY